MAKEAGDNEKGRGAHEPWTNKERHIIVQHVLKHVLANVGYGTIFNELIDVLDKQGLPRRTTQQVSIDQHPEHCPSGQSLTYKAPSNNNVLPSRVPHQLQDQWRRKICKELLSIYGPATQDGSDTSPRSPSKAGGGSPGKRKRPTERTSGADTLSVRVSGVCRCSPVAMRATLRDSASSFLLPPHSALLVPPRRHSIRSATQAAHIDCIARPHIFRSDFTITSVREHDTASFGRPGFCTPSQPKASQARCIAPSHCRFDFKSGREGVRRAAALCNASIALPFCVRLRGCCEAGIEISKFLKDAGRSGEARSACVRLRAGRRPASLFCSFFLE